MIQYHIGITTKFGEKQIEEREQELDRKWAPLKHASKNMGVDIELEKETDGDQYTEIIRNIQGTIDAIDEEGERLLDSVLENGDHLWGPFKKVYEKSQSEDGVLEESDINTSQIDELEEAGLIHSEVRYHVSIT